jgi:hypothetical protein
MLYIRGVFSQCSFEMEVPPPISNYPRDAYSQSPRPKIEHIGTAFHIVFKNLGVFVGATLLWCVAIIVLYLVFAVPMIGVMMATSYPKA